MPAVELRPLDEGDLDFLSEVRHDRQTLCWLHDDRRFSLEEVGRWFARERPEWYVILHEGLRVGYIRTSDRDDRNRSLKIGADIHPEHRRKGYALAAYRLLLDQLKQQGWHRIWLEVLADNDAAIGLYEKLGFRREGCKIAAVKRGDRWHDSILMSLVDERQRGRHVKVIVVYLGKRRGPPRDARETFELLQFLFEREGCVDPGCATETLLVYNRFEPGADDHAATEWVGRCEELLGSVDGEPTRRGRFQLLTRENVGLSFGGYNHAFSLCAPEYDYWLFTEDDQVMVRDGYFGRAIDQMQADPSVGFVAVVGVSPNRAHPPHAHGGVGVSSRRILRDVKAANPCQRHPEGHLPYHVGEGYENQESLGEIRFTNAIHNLGYRLVDLAMDEVCLSWGDTRRRTPRMVPWTDETQH
jgi:RimJ/RimL family protein N-acetyltransferase